MAKSYYDITLALAGICQSANLVQQLAQDGQCDNSAMRVSLNSIFQLSPESTLAVYGEHERDLRFGLEALLSLLNSTQQGAGMSLTRYVISMIILAGKLMANSTALGALSDNIEQIKRQLTHFEVDSETILGAIADMYVGIISPMGPRIQVSGSPLALQQPHVQAKVRAVLLAGIRSAVLWKQVGGNRLQLLFFRQRLLNQAQTLLRHC